MAKEKSLTKNSIFYIIYNVLNILFPLVTGIYVARILLPENIGMVESARNLAQYFIILAFLGIPTYGLREISKNRHDKKELNKIFSELFIINFISTIAFFSIYLAVIFSLPIYSENVALYLLTGALIIFNIFDVSWLYEGLEDFKFILVRNIIFKILSFVFLVIFVRNPSDYYIYAAITVFGTVGNYLLNIIHSRKIVKFTFKNLNFRRHLKSIIFLVVVNLAIEIYMLLDVTMLGIMCDKSRVAYYAYGMKIYRILCQVINAFTIVVVPRLSLLFKDSKEKFNELLMKTYRVILILAVPLIIGIFAVSDFFFCLLYGDAYISSSYVLKILSVLLVISPTGYLLGSRVMLVTGNEKKMIIPVAVGAAVNIVLNAILIIRFQEVGAAIASVISEIFVMVIYLALSKKHFKFVNMKRTLYNIAISSAAMTVFLFAISFFENNLVRNVIAVIGAVLIYFIFMITMRDETTFEFYKKLKSKTIGKMYAKK